MARGEVRVRLIGMLTCPTVLFDKLLDLMGVLPACVTQKTGSQCFRYN